MVWTTGGAGVLVIKLATVFRQLDATANRATGILVGPNPEGTSQAVRHVYSR